MKKILIVFGTCPEVIKTTPLVKEFQKYEDAYKQMAIDHDSYGNGSVSKKIVEYI